MKKYSGISYCFRPASYWSDADPLSAILRNVKGENRRQMITDYWKAGRLEDLEPSILLDEQDDETRKRRGRIHPSFIGGEYLPSYLPGEVEIARICLQSITRDVVTLRARPVPEGIAYRAADEYEGRFTLPIPVSALPLSLEEVVRQFDEGTEEDLRWDGGLALGYNNLSAENEDRTSLRRFTNISSVTYHQLWAHYEHAFVDWAAEPAKTFENSEGGAS